MEAIADLTTSATRLACAVAVLGDCTRVARAAALAGLELDEAERQADALADAGVLAPDRPLRFAQPLFRGALYGCLGPGARANAHRRAVHVLACESPAEAAEHAMLVEPAGDPVIAGALIAAGRAGLDSGSPRRAATLLQRALVEPPAHDQFGRAVASLGIALARAGDPRAKVVLSAVPDGDDELVDALWLGGHHDRAVRGGSTGFERCCATAALIASDELEAAESAIDEIERSATAAGDEPLLAVVELLRRRCRSVRSEAEPASELFPGPDPGPEPRPETNSARAVAFLDHGGIEAIEQAVALLRESPRHGLLAGALLDLGRELRHAGRRCKARAALREALDLAQRLDCHELADQARDELRIAGARPRRERLSGPASLTAAEWRVARAAANGITNREIAAQLFLSPKTVEMHLGRIYRKLDVASRAEMTGALELRPLAAAA